MPSRCATAARGRQADTTHHVHRRGEMLGGTEEDYGDGGRDRDDPLQSLIHDDLPSMTTTTSGEASRRIQGARHSRASARVAIVARRGRASEAVPPLPLPLALALALARAGLRRARRDPRGRRAALVRVRARRQGHAEERAGRAHRRGHPPARRGRRAGRARGRPGDGHRLRGQAARLVSLDELRWIHLHKTAKLLQVSCATGAVLAGADKDAQAVSTYADDIVAFQVADDILDVTATTEQLGKTAGKDLDADKTTYPAADADGAREEARRLYKEAIDSPAPLATARRPCSPSRSTLSSEKTEAAWRGARARRRSGARAARAAVFWPTDVCWRISAPLHLGNACIIR